MVTSLQTRLGESPEEGIKEPCVASTPENITLSGEQTINTLPNPTKLRSGDRVLVRSQTNLSENGIYIVSSTAWARAKDFNDSDDVIRGQFVIDTNEANPKGFSATYTVFFLGEEYNAGTTDLEFINPLTSGYGDANVDVFMSNSRVLQKLLANGHVRGAVDFTNVEDARNNFDPITMTSARIVSLDGGVYVWDPDSVTDEDGGIYSGSVIEVVGHIGSGRLVNVDNPINVMSFGAKKTFTADDIVFNTARIQEAVNSAKSVMVPNGVWYDWQAITMPDYSKIIDSSGYDARASEGREQSYNRIILNTTDNTGTTNGNTEWLTGAYHPAYAVHSLAGSGNGGSRGSFIVWAGTQGNDTQYGTQITQNLTNENSPFIEINGYDQVANPSVATALLKIAHPKNENEAGALFVGKGATTGFTFDIGLAGLPVSTGYLNKNFTGAFSLPSGSTAPKHNLVFRRGTDIDGSIEVRPDSMKIISGTASFLFKDDGCFEATHAKIKKKIVALPDSTAGVGAVYETGAVLTNSLYTSLRTKSLPTAKEGDHFEVVVTNASGVRFSSSGLAAIIGSNFMRTTELGASVKFVCYEDGQWFPITRGVWTYN